MSEIASHRHSQAETISMLLATVCSFMVCYLSGSLLFTVIVGMLVYLLTDQLL